MSAIASARGIAWVRFSSGSSSSVDGEEKTRARRAGAEADVGKEGLRFDSGKVEMVVAEGEVVVVD